MKKPQFLVLCTLTVVIVSLVVRIQLQKQEPLPSRDSARAASVTSKNSLSGAARRISQPRPPRGGDVASTLTVHATEPHPGHPDGEDPRARGVETRARENLARLNENLHLSKDQQQRIFSLLARNDPEFQPSMTIGSESPRLGPGGVFMGSGPAPAPASGPLATIDRTGTTRPASIAAPASPGTHPTTNPTTHLPAVENRQQPPNEHPSSIDPADLSMAIMTVLTPEQQAAYEDALIDEGLWWADIIAQIESGYNRSHPTAVAAPEVLEDEAAGESLFDLIGR